jgi:arylsulfatase A-like enzyme
VRAAPRSLVLVTVDCLRADHVGFLGYSGETTPFLDSLAEESFVFHSAIASGVPTYYSLPALFASRHPLALGRDIIGIAPDENTLATELKECGRETAAFVAANPYISRACGYDRGFDTFCDFLKPDTAGLAPHLEHDPSAALRTRTNQLLSKLCHSVPVLRQAYDEIYFQYCQRRTNSPGESLDGLRRFPSADVVVDRAIAWLDEHSSQPFFLWLHLMDPHAPYYPQLRAVQQIGLHNLDTAQAKRLNAYWYRGDLGPDRLQRNRKAIVALYDAGIRWADLQIKRLAQKLQSLNVWNQCVVALTSDHGEEFLEHGGRFHSPNSLYEELVHVPLLFRVPGYSARRDARMPIGLIDLAPTLLSVLEISVPASFTGRSSWRQLINGQSWDRPVITECVHGCNNPLYPDRRLGARLMSVRQRNFKLVINFASGMEELFDLRSDPNERNPLPFGTAVEQRRSLLECARQHIAQAPQCRDTDLRFGARVRDLRIRWERSTASKVN